VDIFLSVEAADWETSITIVANYPDTPSYLWIVPDYQDATCIIKVVICDSTGNPLDEDSVPSFCVGAPKFRLFLDYPIVPESVEYAGRLFIASHSLLMTIMAMTRVAI